MKQEEKDRIDYEIEAKRKAKNKEMAEWNIAIFLAVIFMIIIGLIFKSL